jgi:ATP synthase protein I
MTEIPDANDNQRFSQRVGEKETRKLRAIRKRKQSVWFGFATFGLIGWSVALPALVGAAIGVWLDKHHAGTHSWTLSLLIAGLTAGCFNAWHWVSRQNKQIQKEEEQSDEGK